LAGLDTGTPCPECGGQHRTLRHPGTARRRNRLLIACTVVGVAATLLLVWSGGLPTLAGTGNHSKLAEWIDALLVLLSLGSIFAIIFVSCRFSRRLTTPIQDIKYALTMLPAALLLWFMLALVLSKLADILL
ncbi:MAG: hypothetical protein WD114_00005, partial [Phycisphaerales bacterium]